MTRGYHYSDLIRRPVPEYKPVTIGFIYGTSYLMLDWFADPALILLAACFKRRREGSWFRSETHETFAAEALFRVVRVVPDLVVSEIRRHFSDPEKEQRAKRARKVVAGLLEQGAQQVTLSGIVTNRTGDSLLSADSPTDKKLLAFALQQAGADWDHVVMVTDDGGILYDMVNLRTAGKPLYCYTKEAERKPGFYDYFNGVVGRLDKAFVEHFWPQA